MLELETARQQLMEHISPVTATELVPLLEAPGRILAEDAVSTEDQPPFARSPLDGYALRGADTKNASKEQPKEFRVLGKVCAGDVFSGIAGQNEAVRIMTGAPLPKGTDTVIRQEDSDYGQDKVLIFAESAPYQNCCPQGEDYVKGTLLLHEGTLLNGTSVAVLASIGLHQVRVYQKPSIAVISTGDEIIQPGNPLSEGKIYNSNLYFVCGRLIDLKISPASLRHCPDHPQSMADEIRRISPSVDMIITTGGVSVGEKDIMHKVIEELGAKRLFWRVSLKPGAPTLAAVYKGTLLICLSGNPFGAAANFELLVRPVLSRLTRDESCNLRKEKAVLEEDFPKPGNVRRFIRGYTKSGKAWPVQGNHVSGALSSMLSCNCLIELAAEQKSVKKGAHVWVHLL